VIKTFPFPLMSFSLWSARLIRYSCQNLFRGRRKDKRKQMRKELLSPSILSSIIWFLLNPRMHPHPTSTTNQFH